MRKLAGVVMVLALGMVLSGCFVMRTLTFTEDTVDAGKKTTAKISVSGDTVEMMRMRGELEEHRSSSSSRRGAPRPRTGASSTPRACSTDRFR